MKGFTKCANGHYYKDELKTCPYCPGGNKAMDIDTKGKTQSYDEENKDGDKTRMIRSDTPLNQPVNSTVFGEEVISEIAGKEIILKEYRNIRKLVGWLVTYSFDKTGTDFRIYEGRNVIGRDADCNVTVCDKMVSGKHATILFRNDKFKIKDELSSHGTYVNDCDIEDEHVELHDNDLIRMGETVFKFKSAI
jgi:hypothetical protein